MSIGTLILTVTAILVFAGVLQRVLDRMHLTDRAALILIAAMFFGTLLPEITLGRVVIGVGGGVIPLGVCAWLLFKADEPKEVLRALLGTLLTGGAIFALSVLLPDEPEAMFIEPNLLYGAAGGVIAWLLGRSRRGAFICGTAGIVLADAASAVINWSRGVDQPLVIGGGGISDAVVISGVLAVLITELVGEIAERIARNRKQVGNT